MLTLASSKSGISCGRIENVHEDLVAIERIKWETTHRYSWNDMHWVQMVACEPPSHLGLMLRWTSHCQKAQKRVTTESLRACSGQPLWSCIEAIPFPAAGVAVFSSTLDSPSPKKGRVLKTQRSIKLLTIQQDFCRLNGPNIDRWSCLLLLGAAERASSPYSYIQMILSDKWIRCHTVFEDNTY